MAPRRRRYPDIAVGAANLANRDLAGMTIGMNAARTFRCFTLAYHVAGSRREAFLDGWLEEIAQAEDEAWDLFPKSEQLELF